MNFDTDLLRRLRATPEIFAQIAASRGPELALQERLRARFPADLVRAALTLVELRRRAASKFSRAAEMWFDRVGLEQSTAEAVARHKARRFAGRGPVWDLCCGMGGDAIQLAAGGDVRAVDRDPGACLCTQWNGEVYGVSERLTVACGDVATVSDRDGFLHIDPDRRPARTSSSGASAGGRRSLKLEEGTPDLEFLTRLAAEFRGGAIKCSPASNFGGKFVDVEVELVSLDGECKEATIWFGELAEAGLWRATALPSGETLAGDPLSAAAPVAGLGRYLINPDPALVRSGLIDLYAVRHGISRLDDAEEYLTGDAIPASHQLCPKTGTDPLPEGQTSAPAATGQGSVPVFGQSPSHLAHAFEVVAQFPNNEREIRDYFRSANVGSLEIMCRRIPIDIEGLRRRLTLSGHEPAVLIFARIEGRARAVVCRRTR
ncbi:MAG TPA: class I SAM-dependent methyltransferase [Planctomycetaceae bacterium]|nr:class I SAM-dependent methyltransferase [Planctomycetaceae bacterium]